jgi:hypothetical protein
MLALTLRLNVPIVSVLLCAGHFVPGAPSVAADDRIREIIENVRANEALYDNIEVRMVDNYELIDRKPLVGKAGGNTIYEKSLIGKDIRYVSQNGMFRVDVEGKTTTAENTLSEDRISMFDGRSTRVLDQEKIGNIIEGRRNDYDFIRPHMLLLRESFPRVSLSTYLQGHAAMAAVPDANWNRDHTLDVVYQGEAEFQGLKCHKVWITTSVPGVKELRAPYGRFELWLAEDRNYIPIRLMVYAFRWSSTLAIKEGSVSSFREVEEGIWFPAGASILRYADMAVYYEKRQKPYGRYTYEVKEVSLNPKYDISFFRDLRFVPGTAVYELENDKIIKSYTVGLAGDPALNQRRWLWWVLTLNVALVLAIVGAVYLRQRRKRRQAVA